ncbi:lipopolysaccharide-assembly, LptC-related [mine drainage metagenome]|uniref:Lipopolysaccharide-assembly, LptC-related n=1 Tax=mine drainage metagenome TaxID=410659 RepID=A0A1J5SHT4_9ZZZZ
MDIRIGSEDRVAPPAPSRPPMNGHRGPSFRRIFARYTRFVGIMRLVLPAIAAALLGLVLIWPKVAPRNSVFRAAFAGFNLKTIDTMAMQNPRYYGTDNQNMPFTVTARVATQVDTQSMAEELEKPQADFTTKGGAGVILQADNGLFRQKVNLLDLLGHVDLYEDTGYEVHSNSARINVATNDASGDEPTHGHGPAGTITGEGFRMLQRGQDIIFTGKAHAVLFGAHGPAPDHPKKAGKARKPTS